MKKLLMLGLLATAAGCQPTTPTATTPAKPALTAKYAQPNFAPPKVVAPAPVAPTKVAIKPTKPAPKVTKIAGIPAAWVPNASPRAWDYIVIHHSASAGGNAAVFDRQHKAKGWDELGYHFVIDNGSGNPDGLVEVGSRWPVQKWGAHAKTPDNKYNETGIGICLVGNFDETRPTAKQMQSLAKLVSYLMATYKIPADHVIGHRETGKATDCPGDHFPIAAVRRSAAQMLAGTADEPFETHAAGN
jgi:hypothetical protein